MTEHVPLPSTAPRPAATPPGLKAALAPGFPFDLTLILATLALVTIVSAVATGSGFEGAAAAGGG